MNKLDLLNQVLNNLNRIQASGIQNAKLIVDSVDALQLLGQVIAKEDADREKAPVTEEASTAQVENPEN